MLISFRPILMASHVLTAVFSSQVQAILPDACLGSLRAVVERRVEVERSRDRKRESPIHSYNDFVRELKASGMNDAQLMASLAAAQSDPENKRLLGRGSNGSVFSVNGIEHYVFKVPHEVEVNKEAPGISAEADPLPGMNIGQPVARLGGRITVHKRQAGRPAGMPSRYWTNARDRSARQIAMARVELEQQIKAASDMPDRAYEQLAREMTKLADTSFSIDPKAGNVLIDLAGGTFNLVDVDYSPGSAQSSIAFRRRNVLTQMTTMLLDTDGTADMQRSAGLAPNDLSNRQRQEVLRKIIRAGAKIGAKLPADNSSVKRALQQAGVPEEIIKSGTFEQWLRAHDQR